MSFPLIEFCKGIAIIFIVVHFVNLVLDAFTALGFFDHFSNPRELLNGLWALFHCLFHTVCTFLGACLHYGLAEGDSGLLQSWILGVAALTIGSAVFLILAIMFHPYLTLFEGVAWTLHTLFFATSLIMVGSVWMSIKDQRKKGPTRGDEEAGTPEEVEGAVQQDEGITTPTLFWKSIDSVTENIGKDAKTVGAKVLGFLGLAGGGGNRNNESSCSLPTATATITRKRQNSDSSDDSFEQLPK